RVLRAVQRVAGVVAHATVHADVQAGGVVADPHGLDGTDFVDRDAGGPGDVAAGFEGEDGQWDAARSALCGDGVDDARGQFIDRAGVVDRGVGDAAPPAEIEHGQRGDGAELGMQLHDAAGRFTEAVDAEDLRSDVAV